VEWQGSGARNRLEFPGIAAQRACGDDDDGSYVWFRDGFVVDSASFECGA
jgi:hypothetical protein